MSNFTSLLIQTCTIQAKSLATSGYEQVASWSNVATLVPCRFEMAQNVNIKDTDYRKNMNDDTFFFNPDVVISRGNRIVLDGANYDVININKCYDSTTLHHVEVIARFVDNK